MEKDFNDKMNSITEIEPPKGLKQAVLQRLEKEKMKKLARELLYFRVGFVFFAVFSVVAGAVFGKEVLSSEFFSIASLAFSDMRIVAAMWQDYMLLLLETLPIVSITAILLPVFICMLLLQQYGKLQQGNKIYSFKY